MARFNSRFTSVKFEDGGSLIFVLDKDQGNFDCGPFAEENRDTVRKLHRGSYDGSIPTDDLQQTWSLTFDQANRSTTDGTADRIMDWVLKKGSCAAGTTTDSGGLEWRFKITVTFDDGTTQGHMILPNCRVTSQFTEAMDGNSWSLSGVNDGTPTFG
jgi:hypothetical protein